MPIYITYFFANGIVAKPYSSPTIATFLRLVRNETLRTLNEMFLNARGICCLAANDLFARRFVMTRVIRFIYIANPGKG